MKYIKTNHKWARQRDTTLIELSVVIAVILLLVGVLFIGIQAWRGREQIGLPCQHGQYPEGGARRTKHQSSDYRCNSASLVLW